MQILDSLRNIHMKYQIVAANRYRCNKFGCERLLSIEPNLRDSDQVSILESDSMWISSKLFRDQTTRKNMRKWCSKREKWSRKYALSSSSNLNEKTEMKTWPGLWTNSFNIMKSSPVVLTEMKSFINESWETCTELKACWIFVNKCYRDIE